ncbi:Oligopeptide transport system permease protein OppB [Blautia producta]|uniref:Oligopeptide transport system permease protein OppB n=1 Tax=Blautia producta TaxID=33035 RepID=A0A4P6LZA1_9FIRM|nr:Oligopeptide transport system permease protein OppB [Blautia producta]
MNTSQKFEFLLKKLIQILLSMLVLSILVFFIARLSPGDPLKSYYGESVERMNEGQKEKARERLGLDAPMTVQYVRWVENALHGDFGISYKYKQDVGAVIEKVYANTLILGGLSYVLTFVLAVLLGVFCAMRENTFIDRCICKIGTVTNCIPSFFVALVLILIFGVNLAVLPTSGAYALGGEHSLGDRLVHLILPVTVMVLSHLWYYTYMVRNKLLEEIREDYVLLCKVKGMGKCRIMFTHCLRKILPSLISIMAISVPHIIGGTYIAESVFSYPGLGTLSMESAQYHDYNMLMVLSLITGFAVIVANVAGQIISEWIDPRMKQERGEKAE